MSKTYYYKFEDGYFFYYAGRMSKTEKAWEIMKHGKIVIEKIV